MGTDERSGIMKDRQAPEWLDTLGRCGLEVKGEAAPDGPPVNAAIYAVSGFEVEPVVAIPASTAHAADKLDEAWHHHASQASLYGENGEFLILPPTPGGSEVGWVRVKDPVGKSLPSRISGVTGSPEFVAVSVDGRHLCAASVEESDYWVVVHEF
ncbi:hypothetical protein GCM10010251_44340 [Streptomyces aurantiogriseus]|uniref:Uncharacterized protein n=2 Tax=Streptomyces aurantiogriseus TaxID=66870 RepID=A0A918CGT4_9ACTN|nr:hypothetical protein GCM10010251_44340 [Streptomyces aurantiogriseus]